MRLLVSVISHLPDRPRRRLVRWYFDRVFNRKMEQHVHGREHIPEGPCLFISNHLSNADAFTIERSLRPKQVVFLAGVKLKSTTLTRVGMDSVSYIPIRAGAPDVEAIKAAIAALKSGQSVLIFPEGTRSRSGMLIRARKGAGLIARMGGVPVVPLALAGTERFLPIKDQDMGGETVHSARVDVWIGKPFTVDQLELDPSEPDEKQALADAMMRRVAELLPPEYRGLYR